MANGDPIDGVEMQMDGLSAGSADATLSPVVGHVVTAQPAPLGVQVAVTFTALLVVVLPMLAVVRWWRNRERPPITRRELTFAAIGLMLAILVFPSTADSVGDVTREGLRASLRLIPAALDDGARCTAASRRLVTASPVTPAEAEAPGVEGVEGVEGTAPDPVEGAEGTAPSLQDSVSKETASVPRSVDIKGKSNAAIARERAKAKSAAAKAKRDQEQAKVLPTADPAGTQKRRPRDDGCQTHGLLAGPMYAALAAELVVSEMTYLKVRQPVVLDDVQRGVRKARAGVDLTLSGPVTRPPGRADAKWAGGSPWLVPIAMTWPGLAG